MAKVHYVKQEDNAIQDLASTDFALLGHEHYTSAEERLAVVGKYLRLSTILAPYTARIATLEARPGGGTVDLTPYAKTVDLTAATARITALEDAPADVGRTVSTTAATLIAQSGDAIQVVGAGDIQMPTAPPDGSELRIFGSKNILAGNNDLLLGAGDRWAMPDGSYDTTPMVFGNDPFDGGYLLLRYTAATQSWALYPSASGGAATVDFDDYDVESPNAPNFSLPKWRWWLRLEGAPPLVRARLYRRVVQYNDTQLVFDVSYDPTPTHNDAIQISPGVFRVVFTDGTQFDYSTTRGLTVDSLSFAAGLYDSVTWQYLDANGTALTNAGELIGATDVAHGVGRAAAPVGAVSVKLTLFKSSAPVVTYVYPLA
jgi:hypothetical protein